MDDKIATPKLLDEETRLEREKSMLIGKIALEIESILIREGFTMGDWSEIADLINIRSIKYFSRIKIKTIKENYGK